MSDERKPFGTRLTEDLQQRLKIQAIRENKTVEDFVEESLESTLKRKEK